MSSDGTYAPKSPDLSSFYSPGPTQLQAQGQSAAGQFFAGQLQPLPGHYQNPSVQYQNQLLPPQSQLQPHEQQHHSLHTSPYFSHRSAPAGTSPKTQPQPRPPQQQPGGGTPAGSRPLHPPPGLPSQPVQNPSLGVSYTSNPQKSQYFSPSSAPPTQPTPQQQEPVHSQPGYAFHSAPPPSTTYHNYFQPYGDTQFRQAPFSPQPQPFSQQPPLLDSSAPPPLPSQLPPPEEVPSPTDPGSHPGATDHMPPRRGAAQAAQQQAAITPSPVRTRFPTARIKRIMQADEEVGKVAQQTPIAVGKALELFMVALVSKSADVAKEKNSKRVTAQMLKHVVESDDQWDFLRDIVGKVENEEKAGRAGKVKAESESEEEVVEKKKGRPGRKKKV